MTEDSSSLHGNVEVANIPSAYNHDNLLILRRLLCFNALPPAPIKEPDLHGSGGGVRAIFGPCIERNRRRAGVFQAAIDFSDEIQQEDIRICESVQKGLASRSYQRGRFSVKRENGVHHFHGMPAESVAAP